MARLWVREVNATVVVLGSCRLTGEGPARQGRSATPAPRSGGGRLPRLPCKPPMDINQAAPNRTIQAAPQHIQKLQENNVKRSSWSYQQLNVSRNCVGY